MYLINEAITEAFVAKAMRDTILEAISTSGLSEAVLKLLEEEQDVKEEERPDMRVKEPSTTKVDPGYRRRVAKIVEKVHAPE